MLLPSPTTSDANGAGAHGAGGPDLRTAVLMPTPSKADGDGGHLSSEGHQTTLPGVARDLSLMPTPRAGDGEKGGPNQRGSSGDLMLPSAVTHLLPTPTSQQDGSASDLDRRQERIEAAKEKHGRGFGESLDVAVALLGTPTARDHKGSGQGERLEESERRGQVEAQDLSLDLLPTPAVNDMGGYDNGGENYFEIITENRWGKYAAAIARWEAITRPAPEPTNITEGYLKALAKRLARQHAKPVGMRGSLKPRRQLAARFSEWMMGVPLGWITDIPGITRNEALKAAGNGVVPQQAAEALRFLLDMPTGREIADAHEPDDLFELLAVGE